jgi:ribosomal protein L11 methyltransferase
LGHVRCRLRAGVSDALALREMRALGLRDESVVEDSTETIHIFGFLPDQVLKRLDSPPLVFLISEATPFDPTIDWEKQWATSGANYREGHVYLDLDRGMQIKLKPGPGFGDLSHPTTRLIIDLMRDHVTNRDIVDLGAGSGILSFAAIGLGAKSAIGIEIDAPAILHAQENATLNNMQDRVTFIDPSDTDIDVTPNGTYLMNMIPADQEALLTGLSLPTPLPGTWFVSGVLVEKRDEYLRSIADRQWKIVRERSEGGWLAFHFQSM